MLHRIFQFYFLLMLAVGARAGTPPLLNEAVRKWVADQDRWAYTQHVCLIKEDKVTQERVERFDPSLPAERQWQLLEVSGKPPTAAQRKTWQKKKERELHQRSEKPLGDYFNFERATVAEETSELVRYEVPLLPDTESRYPLEKISVLMTVRKDRQVLDQLTAGLRESFRMALGTARVTNLGLDIHFRTIDEHFSSQPESIHFNGGLQVGGCFKVGGRAELAWTDFKRVTPYKDRFIHKG